MGKIAKGGGTANGTLIAPVDWQALKREIVEKLDLAAEFQAMGVRFTGPERSSGWRECHALGRPDEHPSAAVNLRSGIYKADGQDGEVLGLFDFALKYGEGKVGTKYLDVLEHFADKAGVPLPTAPRYGDKGRIEEIYSYVDDGGEVRYEVVRYRRDDGSKTFRQRRPDGYGGYVSNLKGVDPLPYRLPELLEADPSETVLILEGEKDAERARAEGFTATCNHQGSGNTKAWDTIAAHFRGRDCCIIPDNDPPGRQHAHGVAARLAPLARSVKVLSLPSLPLKGDLSDWFDAGGAAAELGRLIYQAPAWSSEAAPAEGDLSRDANVGDIRVLQSDKSWFWKGWIPNASLTLLAAEGGTGKTRFCFDLHRRIYHGTTWPDGTPISVPLGAKTLWVVADNHWQEMCDIPAAFGIPDEAVILNATAADPYAGTSLQSAEELEQFEARIIRARPALVIIDTITNTGDFKAQDAADAKLQYKPLQEIATRTQVPILCVTHLNANGKVLGRRAVEKVRSVIQMEMPDPENQPHRRKLWVSKSNAVKPAPLGITMGDLGNEYDENPPAAPESGRLNGATTGPPPAKTTACAQWLTQRLALGPARVSDLRREAEEQLGYSVDTLYKAMRLLKIVEDLTDGRKWWKLPANNENGYAAHGEDQPF